MLEPNDDQWKILRWEDHIVPILEHPNIHIRDKALIAVQWELHARSSELHRLSFGDLEDRGDHMNILLTRPNDRKRLLPLCGSMPYLKKWVQAEHPVAELLTEDADPLEEAAPETPIWTTIHSNKDLSMAQLRSIIRRACKSADVPREITLHDIRRSRAKRLAVQLGLRTPALRERFGWEPHKHKQFVETFQDEDLNGGVRPRPPIKCPECGAWTPPHQPCLWCGADH
ncbi:tyrosine-type recombinase/integrase [Natronomonas gomsonensis]|uniref:tyrosine-type recombinase/integrase n=1 Tax=Natronomonas gomsonensis TaxID=1046043 RepID=UPI0015C002A9|nr:tyrosine-type recombinase/integrase [Natronomonas gomsonensis]